MNPAPAEPSRPLRPHREDAEPAMVIAVVVSFNSAIDLPPCLASLETQHGVVVSLHVVDNASADGSAELVRRDFPRAHLTTNASNVGFARANNQVLERETAEFYALVNPDTILPTGAVAACVDQLRCDPRIGVVSTRLINPDGSLQPSCHAFLGLRNLLGETFGLHRVLPGVRTPASVRMSWFAHDTVAEVDWITGAFLVVRSEMIRAIGAFDPEFFMYGEEMDLCRRARRAGWKVIFVPKPSVVHVGGASSRPIAGPMLVEALKGRLRFLRKHRGPLVATMARFLIGLSVLLRFTWREAQSLGGAIGARSHDEAPRLKRTMFRAAVGWVLRGLPLSPPDFETAPPRS